MWCHMACEIRKRKKGEGCDEGNHGCGGDIPIPIPIPVRGLGLDEVDDVDGPRMCFSTLALQVVIELFFAGIAEFLCCIWLGRSREGTELGKLNEAIYVNVYLGRTIDSRKKYY